MIDAKRSILLLAVATLILPSFESTRVAHAQVSSGRTRPFVIGVVPVIGRRGAVGGITVDPEGAVSAMQTDDRRQLDCPWQLTPADAIRAGFAFRVLRRPCRGCPEIAFSQAGVAAAHPAGGVVASE